MKKIIMLALMVITFTVTAFSRNSHTVNRQVLNTFNKTYTTAKEVKWEAHDDYMKATFKVDGQQMFAYYRTDGEQIAVTRHISSTQLPLTLSAELKSKCDKQWITELFEISVNGETSYYATLYSADQATVLKAEASGSWSVFKKSKRTAQ